MRILLFLSAIITLYSCNNDLATIGQNLMENENFIEMKQFKIQNTSTVKLDSFITSSSTATGNFALNEIFIGKYTDKYSGTTVAIPCFQIAPSNMPILNFTFTLDSVVFNFKYNGKIWGDTASSTLQTFELHQLGALPELNEHDYNFFFNTQPLPPLKTGVPLGTASFIPRVDNMGKAYFKVDKAFGEELFRKMVLQDPIFEQIPWNFINSFKGLIIKPADGNTCLIGISALPGDLYMRVHFHKGEERFHYDIGLAQKQYQFNSILNTPIPVLASLDNQQKEVSFDQAGMAIIQGMSGYMIKMLLPNPPLQEQYTTIIKAELELKPLVFADATVPMPTTILGYRSNVLNEKLIDPITGTIFTGQYIKNQADREQNRYIFDLTSYYDALSKAPPQVEEQNYILLSVPSEGTSFNRLILEEIPVLRIYYASYNN